jgi:monoamine oxidase
MLRNRRELLRFLGAGALGAAVPAVATPSFGATRAGKSADPSRAVDVVVVGAGFAGLTAARRLARRGRSVVVLEARDRVGGRVKAGTVAGRTVDVGGMWVGPTQTHLLEALREFGLRTTPQYVAGGQVVQFAGRRWTAPGEAMGFDPETENEVDAITAELDHLSAEVPLDAPWTAPRAAEFDAISAQEWFEARTSNETIRRYWRYDLRNIVQADLSQVSFLFLLFYIRSADNVEMLFGYEGGAQAMLVREGMHTLAAKMAAALGDRVVLRAPVRSIAQDDGGVVVVSDTGSWRAAAAVVAVPLPLSTRIAYTPPLPPERDALAQRTPMGSVIKWYAAYETPFWRAGGLNGLVVTDLPPGAICVDVTPPEGKPGLLAGFIDTPHALLWTGRSVEERRRMVLDRLVDLFGEAAARPIDYEDQNWPAEEWSRGCYEAWMGPTVLTTLGKFLRAPHGRVHWAGTETSPRWMGYIEGAIRSGERVADEIP